MIKAIKDNIIVKPNPPKEQSFGVIIPESSRKAESVGLVVSVGNEIKSLKTNDFVFFTLFSGNRFTHNDEEYIKFKEHEVYAVFE